VQKKILALFTWFVTGVGLSLVQTPSGRIVNISATPSDRSSYFSAQFALSHLCWLITYPLVGQLVLYFGFGFSAAFLACIILTCFIFSIDRTAQQVGKLLTNINETEQIVLKNKMIYLTE
jgi:Na+/melibiose symporter-like transporter